jgi:hypothetical protein
MTADPLRRLATVARKLAALDVGPIVFVGGATIGLYLTDPASPPPRPTMDVDAVVDGVSRQRYYRLENRLREAGYDQPMSVDAPICRWDLDGIAVDIMPVDEGVLGFSNRWYRPLAQNPVSVKLPDGEVVDVAAAPYAVAAKLDAFRDRGSGDYRMSPDLEDILILHDGRTELVSEIQHASDDVRAFIASEFDALLSDGRFVDAVGDHLHPDPASQRRKEIILERMRTIADFE